MEAQDKYLQFLKIIFDQFNFAEKPSFDIPLDDFTRANLSTSDVSRFFEKTQARELVNKNKIKYASMTVTPSLTREFRDSPDELYNIPWYEIAVHGDSLLQYYKEHKEQFNNLHEIQARAQESIPIEIVAAPEFKINTGNKEDKNKFPYKLPAGTRWENFIIKFEDDENVLIKIRQFEHSASYKELGMVGKGNAPNPSESWTFLKVLAQLNGEIAIRDAEAKDKYKKQKEFLAKALQSYFSIDYDPFYPYHSSSEKDGDSYKIKIILIPPLTENRQSDVEKDTDDLGVKDYIDQQTPQVYEEQDPLINEE